MKRRVLSFITVMALCVNLIPVQAFAVDGEGGGLCPHHQAHTDECGYVLPAPGQECAHVHEDGCYTEDTDCIHGHTAECYLNPEDGSETEGPDFCAHACTEDGGCVTRTLDCPHEHDEECGYAPEIPGAPCAFVCKICPIDELIGGLPGRVTAANRERVEAQLREIYELYDGLTGDEQEQVDLSRCDSLREQLDKANAGIQTIADPYKVVFEADGDTEFPSTLEVGGPGSRVNTMGYTVTCASGTVLRVTGTGELDLTGTIEAKSGAGVEVESGGTLRVGSADISGTTYGLVIASGADVKLSGGTFSGGTAAIQADDYAGLLEDGCAFFDGDGNPVRPEDMGTVTMVTVGGCSAHDLKSYETNAGTPEHTWTCDACGATGVEKCTFDTFTDGDNDGSWEGACGDCGNVLTITVVRNSLKELAYGDGKTIEPTAGTVTVTVKDAAAALIEGTDYTVDYSTHTDVGNTDVTVTVTVEGAAYEGEAFTEDYIFTAAELTRPVLEWASTSGVAVTYDGSAVEKGDLPDVTINLTPNTGLDQYLQYSYRKLGETAYTSGLPTNAGDYEVVATLPEELAGEEAGHAVSTEPIALHILKADPLAEIPTAKTLTYNREAQELVTEGKLKPEAAADGAVILFAASENGGYSTAIPSGIDAKDYSVWYKVEATDNCNAVGPAEITGVKIQRKPITPIVTLSKDSYQYDGEYKKPTVTVKDEDNVTVLPDSEYNVKYENNQNVSTEEKPAKVVITDKTGGNYAITEVEVTFEITLKEQQTLSITKQPDVVAYGDRFTLGTTGGSGSGAVTWTITDGAGVAEVGLTSGQVKITGHGEFTVKATKSGTDPTTNVKNYNDATATWTITADKKSVVAVVTAEDKVYGETYGTGSLDEAKVHAVVEQGVLPDDEITITGLTGKFADENAGKDIEVTVTLPASDPISGTNSEHYDVTYSSLKVKATIYKADIKIGTAPQDDKSLTYNRDSQVLLASGAVVIDKTTGQTVTVPVEYALSEEGPYYTDFPKGTNAGDYKVWFRVPETLNYNGIAPDSVDASIKPMRVTPEITLSGDGLTGGPGSYSYVYDGSAKTPAVTVKETAGGAVIPEDGNYTVTYSSNINVGTSAKVTVAAKAGGNYEFTPSSSIDVSFAITKEPAKVLTAPEAAGDPLTFNTRAQKLVTPGAGYGGTMVYSVDNGATYQEQIPTKTGAGDYTVLYKVQGDDNHSDSAVGTVAVTIAPKTVNNPTIELTLVDENGDPLLDGDGNPATSYTYDGKAKKPEVVVKDGSDVIPAGEYNVIYRNNTDAGDAVVSITDKANGNYTVTGSTTFVIQKADLVDPNPQDAGVTYNGEPQPLLTVTPVSGGEIWYALGNLTGPTSAYTDMIPQATNAGDYYVYYKVVGDKNHNDILQKGPVHATIKRQEPDAITIVLSPEGFKYDGGVKMPEITVKVGEVVLPETEYGWACNVDEPKTVGTYTITISDKAGGNYDLSKLDLADRQADFSIGQVPQEALVINGKPSVTNYGDSFQLSVSGGSGTGAVTWEVSGSSAALGAAGADGKVSVALSDIGDVTVTVKKAGDTNYLAAEAEWTFTVAPKPVTAVVEVDNKVYDGKRDATVKSAAIAGDDLVSGDVVAIDETSIKAAFDTASAGTGKTVTLDSSKVKADAVAQKYAISYPGTVTADIAAREVALTITLSDHDLETDITAAPKYYYTFNDSERKPNASVTAVATDNGDSFTLVAGKDYTVGYNKNKNVGVAEVIIENVEGGNFDFADETVNFEIRKADAGLTLTPQANDLTYNGTAQDLVSVGTATGGTVVYTLDKDDEDSYSTKIPQETGAGTYTVYYKVQGDGNHNDAGAGQVSVTIKRLAITPVITLSGAGLTGGPGTYSYEYDGNAKTPAVTITGGVDDNPIDATTEYTVSYRNNTTAGTATVIVSDKSGGNYIVNGTLDFEITKAAPMVTAPKAITGLQYSGSAQELIEAGEVVGGTMLYSLTENGTYSTAVPTGTAVGKYTVWYKVQGDPNHQDTAPARLDPDADADVEIGRNQVNNPTITLSSDTFKYNGSQQKPTIEVKDDKGRVVPETEYETDITPITDGDAGIVNAGTYKITITTPAASNYDITGNNTRTFEIKLADQETVAITGTQTKVQYGDVIQLGATGGIGGSTLTWEIEDKPDGSKYNSEISGTGLLTVKDVGGPIRVKVTRTVANYGDVSAVWEFNAVKRPVTAVVTADDRAYDAGNVTATVNVTVPSGVVFGDTITINGLTGTFEDDRVGTNKKVTIGGGTIDPDIKAKYDVTIPKTTTATIWAEAATVDTDGKPGLTTLTYDASQSQALVTPGTVTGGIMVYSLDGSNFTPSIPKAKDAGTYKVYFKAQGDSNHTDGAFNLAADFVTAEIKKQEVTFGPGQIELSEESVQYDGNKHQPTVTILDGTNNVVPASEYTVTYDTTGGKNWIDKGAYTVKITNRTGGSSDNYIVNDAGATFTITTTPQNTLTITDKPGRVYYGDTFTLSTSGGSGSEAVEWKVEPQNSTVATVDANGTVTINGVGQAKIVAKKPGGDNYADATAEYPLNALKKPVTVTITAEDRAYVSGDTTATLHVTWNGLLGTDSINTDTLQGTFNDDTVGNNKTVTISTTDNNEITDAKYEFTIPAKTTASIYKADQATPGVTANNLTYSGSAQSLVTGGDANTLYSSSQNGVYSSTVPTGTNAGTYTVWYKAAATATHNESEAKGLTVEISRKELTAPIKITLSGNDLQTDEDGNYFYVFDGSEKKPTATVFDGSKAIPASEFEVSYSKNKNVGTDATVTITSKEGGNYTFDEQEVTFAITSAEAQLVSHPQARDLTFIAGQAQALVAGGAANGGHIEYSLDNGTTYDADIPTGIDAGLYTVTYKVVGDDNYADSTKTWTVSVTIKQKEVTNPVVALKAGSGPYTYDGTPKVLTAGDVEVKDGSTVIPDTEYTVSCTNNVDAGTATIRIVNADGGDYIVSGTGTFTIAKADVSGVTPPAVKTGLPYNGAAQELATPGSANGGTMVYSLSQNGPYSPAIPTGADVNDYDIWYKVEGDDNHNGTAAVKVGTKAAIVVNEVTNPTIQVTPGWMTFNGKRQEPTVIVKDDNGLVIDGSEYTVTFTDTTNNNTDLTQAGTYSLTLAATSKRNYDFTGNTVTATFEIVPADQTALSITGTREHVYYGDTIQLGTTGGSEGGNVEWTFTDPDGITTFTNNQLKINGVGAVTVTATSTAAGYKDKTASWSFYADPKPVTAVVTAESKTYDGSKTAAVTAALQKGDLVGSDDLQIILDGDFEDPNAGTNKKVIVKWSNPTLDASSTGSLANYSITYPATTTATIYKADIDTDAEGITLPALVTDSLTYTGDPQILVEPGSVGAGIVGYEYSTDGLTYFTSLPTGTNAGGYDVWYRVKADGNHNDVAAVKLTTDTAKVTIAPQEVKTPIIEFTPTGATYDSKEHKPAVTVKDKNGRTIPESEYTVIYEPDTDWIKAGSHTITVADKPGKTGGNYVITQKQETFTILPMGQTSFTITNQPGKVRYGDSFTLSTTGGSGTGAVTWAITSGQGIVADIDPQSGLVTLHKAGTVVVEATKAADNDGYAAAKATWTFQVEKKPVAAVVTAKDKPYGNGTAADLEISWKPGDLVDTSDETNLTNALTAVLVGTFEDPNVGNGKNVTISVKGGGSLPTSDKYDITYNTTTKASITPAASSVTTHPTASSLTYTGGAQYLLVSNGAAANGTLVYSRDGDSFAPAIPQETNAGTYPVWYKVQGSANYADSPVTKVDVTIQPKTVDAPVIELSQTSFKYDGSPKMPTVTVKDGSTPISASEYTVGYSNNTEIGATAAVTITDNPGGNYIVNGTKQFTIEAGAATLVSAPQARNLTYSGEPQELVTEGVAANGEVVYSLTGDEDDFDAEVPKGTNADSYTVYYKVQGSNGYGDTAVKSRTVTIKPKTVTNPFIELDMEEDYVVYDGNPHRPDVSVVMDGNTIIPPSEYTVSYKNVTNVGTATVTVRSTGTNYVIYATTTFEIVKGKAEFAVKPVGNPNLKYTGSAQNLIKTPGTAGTGGGTVVYSLDGVTFSAQRPTGTEVDEYEIYAKVLGNASYADSDVVTITAKISQNVIAAGDLNVQLSDESFTHTGSAIKPTVTVRDGEGNLISTNDYKVDYKNNVNVGNKAEVTVTSTGKNYSFEKTVYFEITAGEKPALEINGLPNTVCYGDTLQLSATGGSGAVTWSIQYGNDAPTTQSGGRFEIVKPSYVTITATDADGSTKAETFYAYPRPITAKVTAKSKIYDGKEDAKDLLTVTYSGLVNGDKLTSADVAVTATFADTNAGTQTINVTLELTAAVTEKYSISYNTEVTAVIYPAAAEVDEAQKPEAVTGLKYTGKEQPLVTVTKARDAAGGTIKYSLDGETYSSRIPTGTDAGSYTVWYKVFANDDNHKNGPEVEIGPIEIAKNNSTDVVVECKSSAFNGTVQTPTVIVKVDGRTLPKDEYVVEVTGIPKEAKDYPVTVKANPDGNYDFTDKTATFTIENADQNPLSIITDVDYNVYYGDKFHLSAQGGSGSGKIEWNITEGEGTVADISVNGFVDVKGTGTFTVTAFREAADGYGRSNTDTISFYANPKTITPVVSVKGGYKPYDGTRDAELTATLKKSDLVGSDDVTLKMDNVTGQFDTPDVGTNKEVTFDPENAAAIGADVAKYNIEWPTSTTGSINKVNAKISKAPTANQGLTFTGEPLELAAAGETEKNIGKIVYSLSQYGEYTENVPQATGAGAYTVWYKVEDDVNYTGVAVRGIPVTIGKAELKANSPLTAGSVTAGQPLSTSTISSVTVQSGNTVVTGAFAWEDGSIIPEDGQSCNVIFTPDDQTNYRTLTIQVQVTVTGSSEASGMDDAPMTTIVRDGTASTTLSAAGISGLVREAVASQSQNVVIRQEAAGNVTKTEVLIPAPAVGQIGRETDAALTVSTPVADVTIPNAALGTLSGAGGTVDVVTEQTERGVTLALAAGGRDVENVPGGLTLTIPVENAGPGTVAVLVREDGTRETLRKSVVEDGRLSVPLSGPATVEIVDSGKSFDDVPSTGWESEAVAFASAHELFNGTSDTTFSPDMPMSRGMLATVLYNLEGRPAQELANGFDDVSSDAWYAEGITWAAVNGITNGYGNGQFGPDDNITREQFVVMLWKYSGSPKASGGNLDFTDVDQASGYALEALSWAVENGILHGCGDGQLDPGGMATRAQAAQMLKNLLENT